MSYATIISKQKKKMKKNHSKLQEVFEAEKASLISGGYEIMFVQSTPQNTCYVFNNKKSLKQARLFVDYKHGAIELKVNGRKIFTKYV